jgi:polar amino acid transport system substrate-binding protein
MLCVLLPAAALADNVSLRADEWYPYNGTPGSARPGYMIELAQQALAKGGHQVSYALMPWERALEAVRKGEYDCVVGAAKSDAPDFVYPEEPMGRDQTVFYVKKGTAWRYAGIPSLASVKLAVIAGYSYDEELDRYIEENAGKPALQVISGDNALDQNVKKLKAGRVDVVAESQAVFSAKVADMGLKGEFDLAGTQGEPDEVYVACSPARPASRDYARLLTEGVRAMRASGELSTLLEKYGVDPW